MRYVLAGALYLLAATVSAGPAEDAVATLDAFHRALAVGDRDGARARLSQQVIIYEAGIGEYGIEAYAAIISAPTYAFPRRPSRSWNTAPSRLWGMAFSYCLKSG